MKEQDLQHIWKSAQTTNQITIDMSQLTQQFKTGMERREQIVRYRDGRETIFATIGILAYAGIAFYVPFTMARIGAILVSLSLLFLIYKLRTNRKSLHTQHLFLPMQEQLIEQRKFMVNQERLLNTVLYWMALPLFISYLIFIWGVGDPSGYVLPDLILEIIPVNLKSKIVWSTLMALILGYIVWMNKRAAVVNWQPLIKQIDTIITNLKKDKL